MQEYNDSYMILGTENDGLFFVSFEGKVLKRLLKEKEMNLVFSLTQFGLFYVTLKSNMVGLL